MTKSGGTICISVPSLQILGDLSPPWSTPMERLTYCLSVSLGWAKPTAQTERTACAAKTTTNADASIVCKKDSLACWPTSGDRLNSVVSRCLSPWDGMVCRRPTNTTANHLDRWLPDFVFPFCSLTAAWLASPKMFRPLDMVGLCRKGVRFTVVFYLFILTRVLIF